ncbi:MAG: protein kinase [Fimbriimonadales bacterium]
MTGKILGGRYEVLEAISASPVFENYAARDRYKGTDVCVRIVNLPFANETEFVASLKEVVDASTTLDHPNVAKVYGMGEFDGRPFIVCELIRGSNLVERIRRVAPFSPPVACELAIGICEGLHHAAERDIVHGDLCSDHVLATLEGRVAVLDFGLWKCYGKSATAGGVVLARMAPYMAPEIIDGSFPTTASDVYAVGVILFELLTGQLPFMGQTPGAILAKHSTLEPRSPKSVNAAVPNVLEEITLKCLKKDAKDRYGTFDALISDLRAIRDAVRFGRQLTWTLVTTPAVAAAATEAKKETKLPWESSGKVPEPAAPVVATVPVERVAKPPKPPKARRVRPVREVSDDDVPRWLKWVVIMLGGTAVVFVLGWMVLNATKRKEIQLPNLIGMTVAEARQRATSTGFILNVVDEVYSEKNPKPDTIIEMQPDARTPIREGGTVRVVKSLGSKKTAIPDLRKETVEEAKNRLEAAGLKVGEIREMASDAIDEGLVAGTSPARGEKVDRGTTVNILVSGKGRDEMSPRERPNTWTIRFQVKESDEPVMVKVIMTDGTRKRQTVFEEVRDGGDYVELYEIEGVGDEATFRIYFDDRLDRSMRRDGNDT